MKRIALCFGVAIFCLLLVNESYAQSIVKDMSVSEEETSLSMLNQDPSNYLVEIGGPDAYYWKQTVENTNELRVSNRQANGETFPDGSYTMQVTPVYELTAEQRAAILELRKNNDEAGITAFRIENNLPKDVQQFVVNFSIRNGKFVNPDEKEAKMQIPAHSTAWNQDHPALYASVSPMIAKLSTPLVEDKTNLSEDAQVFATDLIVQGSTCTGFDCVSSESFGFDTFRMKENNLRIHFDDTSSSASFPSNDWRIAANDTSNGGDNYLAIQDATAGTTPFKVEAGAGNNALHIDASGGNVGMGTATPVVELHVTDGDSPTMRLEQNGSNGWTPQTWDIAGNETNFFVRDVTNGSKLPFKIRPGAPDNSIYIDAEGDIGLGTANPGTNALQVENGDVYMKAGNLGVNVVPTVALDVLGNTRLTGTTTVVGSLSGLMTGQSTLFSETFDATFHFDAANSRIGIGTATPGYQLHVSTDAAYKLSGGDWMAASDRRLKKDIVDFTDGLSVVMKIRPVKFHYNGKLEMSDEKEFIGVIAQEMQEIAPYTIEPLKHDSEEAKKEKYLAYNGTAVTYLLVNAVQEQQAIIDAQKKEINELSAELAQLQTLKAEVAALAELVKSQKTETTTVEDAVGMK